MNRAREYYKQFHTNQFNNSQEVDKLEDANYPQVTLKNADDPQSPVSTEEVGFVAKNLPTKTSRGPGGSTDNFHQTADEKITPGPDKLSQKPAYEDGPAFRGDPGKLQQTRELMEKPQTDEHKCKISKQNFSKQYLTM